MATSTHLNELYESQMIHVRKILETDSKLSKLLGPAISTDMLHRFLIQFSAWGVQMTEPVEHWIREAGKRCVELGYEELGRTLIVHAGHEAGHHMMMVADTKHLVSRWNENHDRKLDASNLLSQRPTDAMKAYVKLHQDVIASDSPFAQIAIEYEVEKMSTTLGPRLMKQCQNVLGVEIIQDLSFLEEHIAIDVGHTALNEKQLDRFLQKYPESIEVLKKAGASALRTYVAFLGDCLTVSQEELADVKEFSREHKSSSSASPFLS